MEIKQIIQLLQSGKIGVMPTDTIYGIVGSALNPQKVETIYRLRKRSTNKPMIILISSLSDLKRFNIKLTDKQKDYLKKIWPNPISVVLPCQGKNFRYLHRGKNSLAFRIPKNEALLKILKHTGPLVAPSANYEGEKPSITVEEAKQYFGDRVDFYVNGGTLNLAPSTVVKLDKGGKVAVLRYGSRVRLR